MKTKTCRTMSAFYDQCGALLRHWVIEAGDFPAKTHTVIFAYERGEARYDGKSWAWVLDVD